jgi:hypothetical protein
MSGPQGPDPAQPWQQPQGEDQQSADQDQTAQASPWQQPGQAPSGEHATWQAPAYTPTEYAQHQPPPAQFYPPSGQFPQPTAYPQYDQYGAPTGQFGSPPAHYSPQPGPYGSPGPYGQPGQYLPGPPGQYPVGQPGQYPPPGPYGQPPASPVSKRSRLVVGSVIGGFAVVVVGGILVAGFWQPGFFVTTKLDVNKAQAGVQKILTDDVNGYGARNVKDVKCNNGQNPTVKKGGTFVCDVSIDGTKRQVTVTFQDSKGTYEVGRPN